MTLLSLQDVTVAMGGVERLSAINLTIEAGECVALTGPNGAGKSTLLRVAAGLLRPSFGTISIAGTALRALKPQDLASRRGLLCQSHGAPSGLQVEALIKLGMGVSGKLVPAKIERDIVDHMLDMVGLTQKRDRDIATLSGGENQRAHLARVLAQLEVGRRQGCKPGVLLLDEPLSAQDMPNQVLAMKHAHAFADEGGAVLVVLHDLNWAAAWSDRVLVIDEGRIQVNDHPSNALNQATLARHFRMPNVIVGVHQSSGRPVIVPHEFMQAHGFTREQVKG